MTGELWGKDVVAVFVRPQRYTYEFMEKYGDFTLSFFSGEYKKALSFCGAKSGRDYDKAKECSLNAVELGGSVAFEEANLIIACKKIAFADMDPSKFLVPEIEKNYHNGDYHRIYIGEITEVCEKFKIFKKFEKALDFCRGMLYYSRALERAVIQKSLRSRCL